MVASIKVYDDDVDNTLLFDSSRATIPVLFKRVDFTRAQITTFGSGFTRYGLLYVNGLDPAKHFAFIIQSDDPELNSSLPSRLRRWVFAELQVGQIRFSYDVLITMEWLLRYYPNAAYFITILEAY